MGLTAMLKPFSVLSFEIHRLCGMSLDPLDFASQPPMSIYNAVSLLELCGPGTEILDAGLCPLLKSDFYQLSAPSLTSLPTLI
jgi:hypothetical protein